MQDDQNDRPVAYDVNGQPLYAHPAKDSQPANIETQQDDAIKLRHDRSKASFPNLDLSEGEYVIRVVERHPIGMFSAFAIGFLVALVLIILWADIKYIAFWLQIDISSLNFSIFSLVMIVLLAITASMVYMANFIYKSNKMFLTNESVIQEIQVGFFTRHEQIVGLNNVKDVSFSREGIFQQIFSCGTVRLTTEGDDTNYRLSFAKNPHDSVVDINNAIEVFNKIHPTSD